MICGYCSHELIWQSDADMSDIYDDIEGITSTYVCSDCGAVWTGELVDEKEPILLAMWGNMRSGKDTVATQLALDLELAGKKVVTMAYADGITDIIHKYFNVNTNVKPRKHYQYIGQAFRQLDPAVWVNHLNKRLAVAKEKADVIIVTDARQLNEYVDLTRQGFKHIKVSATDEVRKARMLEHGEPIIEEQFNHETEQFVKGLDTADYVIDNNEDFEQLLFNINTVLDDLLGEQ